MRYLVAALAAGALLASPITVAATAAATSTPTVTVSPAKHLAGGRTVSVTGSGLAPSTSVDVVQCDMYDPDDPEDNCGPLTTVTTDASGAVVTEVTLGDPVYHMREFGDPTPVYCRADGCHIFLAWTDDNGVQQFAASAALQFKGAPARIHARPWQNLERRQRIRINGSAYGAQGHRIQVFEEACFGIIQGSGCYGALPAKTRYVRTDGTFALHYTARRFLADGTDCADPNILGACEMTVVVFSHHQPDDSFGVSSIGQPSAALTFRTDN